MSGFGFHPEALDDLNEVGTSLLPVASRPLTGWYKKSSTASAHWFRFRVSAIAARI
jgi:hypothetical protein